MMTPFKIFTLLTYLLISSTTTVLAHIIPSATLSYTLYATKQETILTIKYYFAPELAKTVAQHVDTDQDGQTDPQMQAIWQQKIINNIKIKINQQPTQLTFQNILIPSLDKLINLHEPVVITIKIDGVTLCDQANHLIEIHENNIFTDRNHDSYIIQQDKHSCVKSEVAEYTDYGLIIKTTSQLQSSIFSKINLPNLHTLTDILRTPHSNILPLTAIAFILGVFHSLTPGHGKSLICTYLVGQNGKIRDAISLGLITTITHTSTVFLLGISTLLATKFINLESMTQKLEIISATILTLFGLHLLGKRARELKNQIDHQQTHLHHNHNHSHDHNHAHKINVKSILTIGISGSITPCAEALAILILAINLNRLIEGLILLLAFSTGLSLTIILIGIVSIKLKNLFHNSSWFYNLSTYLPLLSAVIITILGITLLFSI